MSKPLKNYDIFEAPGPLSAGFIASLTGEQAQALYDQLGDHLKHRGKKKKKGKRMAVLIILFALVMAATLSGCIAGPPAAAFRFDCDGKFNPWTCLDLR